MSGVEYEEGQNLLRKGDGILFYSDGLVEAHNQHREMFGSPRLKQLITEHDEERQLSAFLLEALYTFTGEGWEQEDDITILTVRSSALGPGASGGKSDLKPKP
jgi:sigma-B regulation protein RsbU (phosphoserine phosphatase)